MGTMRLTITLADCIFPTTVLTRWDRWRDPISSLCSGVTIVAGGIRIPCPADRQIPGLSTNSTLPIFPNYSSTYRTI
jgi:hypothetical protein